MKPYAWLVLVFAGLSACNGCFGCKSPVGSKGSTLPSACQATQPLIAPQKLDILFVIDNSSSMIEEQDAVAKQLIDFVDELKKGGGVATDFHVGVITTSVYQQHLTMGLASPRSTTRTSPGSCSQFPTVLARTAGFVIRHRHRATCSTATIPT